jgi:gluconate 5-dehydrogenase
MTYPADFLSVRGLRVLVTGSTRGIGRAIAKGFHDGGATVVITGRDGALAQRSAAELAARHLGLALDVADEASVQRVAVQVQERLGGIDVLVNNAGIDPHYALLQDTPTSTWHQIRQTNLDGLFYCCKHFGTPMADRGSGAVINISSIAGSSGLRKQLPYAATKGGVDQITRTLAIDWAETGVRVNGIGFGFIETELTVGMREHAHIAPKLLGRTPMGRFGRVGEVAGAALFLASSAASYITGHTLMVDGGWSAA